MKEKGLRPDLIVYTSIAREEGRKGRPGRGVCVCVCVSVSFIICIITSTHTFTHTHTHTHTQTGRLTSLVEEMENTEGQAHTHTHKVPPDEKFFAAALEGAARGGAKVCMSRLTHTHRERESSSSLTYFFIHTHTHTHTQPEIVREVLFLMKQRRLQPSNAAYTSAMRALCKYVCVSVCLCVCVYIGVISFA
jgi:hypothetical protein